MRSFKAQSKFDPSSTQPQIYSPSRNNYQNRIMNVTQTSKNKNRTQQIVLLHEQFEDLKKKIKQVQNKNQKIIQKIHRQCNFKKKTPQTFDISGQGPIVYYQKKQKSQVSQKSAVSVDQSNKSDQSQYQFRQKKNNIQRMSMQSSKHIPQKNVTQSMQYTRVDIKGDQLKKKYSKISQHQQQKHYDQEHLNSREMIEDDFENESEIKFEMQASHQTYHHLKQYTNNSAKSSGKKSAIISSHPASQTHMGYSMFNQLSSQGQQVQDHQRPSQQQLFTPMIYHQQPSRISQQATQPNSSLIIYQLQENLKIQKQKTAYLEQELKNKQFQILNVRKQYNKLLGQFENVQIILENHLEDFFQNTVKKGFFEIDKMLKKYQNRLRNMAIHIKDQYEEHKSSRIIKEHQLRRSNSRSRRDLSPVHNTSIHSVITPPTQPAKIPRPGSSQGSGFMQQPQNIQPSQTSLLLQPGQVDKRSRISEQSRKNRQFQEIVEKYEEMITSKKEEISKLQQAKRQAEKRNEQLEKKLQQKEVQAKEFKQKLQQLDKLMSQMQGQGPIHTRAPNKQHRISSTETNLLQDIEQQHDCSSQTKFQQLYNQARQEIEQKDNRLSQVQGQIEVYEKKIMEYQVRIREQQIRIKKLQQTSSSQSIKLSQKSTIDTLAKKQLEQSIKQHLNQLHQLQLDHKDTQITKFKQTLNKVEKKLVQKDCECISLNNKVKKLQGINELNLRKIQQYQKLLNHYQHNCSVDMGDGWTGGSVLDRSICYEIQGLTSRSTNGNQQSGKKSTQKQRHSNTSTNRSSNTHITISRNQFQSLQNQLKELSEEILQVTKKLKTAEKINSEKSYEIQKLLEEVDIKSVQVKKYSQLNYDLKTKINDLEEKLQELMDRQNNQNAQIFNQDEEQNLWEEQSKSQVQSSSQQKRSNTGIRQQLHKKRHSELEHQNNYILTEKFPQSRKPSEEEFLHEKHLQESILRLEEQLTSLKTKNLELSAQYNNLKSQHLEVSRNNITIKKNNEYLQESLADRQQKYEKYKKQTEQLKARNAELVQNLQKKQEQLNKQKQQNCQKINQLEKQWHQFEQEINKNNHPNQNLYQSRNNNHDTSQLMKSSRYNISQSSLLLSSTIHNKNSQYLQEQNQYLTIKLKEAEATIEIHNLMEEKVLNEYKANVDKLKTEVKQKNKQLQSVRKEFQLINDAKRRLQVLYQSSKNYLAQSRTSHNITNRKRVGSEFSVKKSQHNNSSSLNNNHQQDYQKDLGMEEFPSYNQDSNNLSMLSAEQHQQVDQEDIRKNQQEDQERLYPYERILQLEGELKQAKDINKKLEQMEEELFKQIRLKEEEKKDLIRLLNQKNLKIQELQEIVELKDNNIINSSHLGSNILGSHISSSNYKSSSNPKQSSHNLSQRQSMHSHSSLRYSGITHLKNPTLLLNNNHSSNNLQVMGQSQFGTSERFQIELSQTGSEMLDKSYVTNISEIFEKEQFPYEKVQLKRKQQIKLFEKTASYIKSLKESINQKNKKIKLLQKKIQSLKHTHHGPISKQLQNKYEISTRANEQNENLEIEFQTVFKDYESVQLQRKKASHSKRYKNLQHEWKLAIEENNVLSNQVQVLQEELQKAEEQQNTILVMKDLYKDEIKKLLAKNQQQTAYYEDLIAKEKAKVQESQSVHNLQTIKQLFLKVMDSIIVMESEKSKKKREEKKKDLEQFFKIFASLCAVQEPKKNAILQGIKKMTLNIVLAEDARGSSKGKQ